jgi:hypothetical protein
VSRFDGVSSDTLPVEFIPLDGSGNAVDADDLYVSITRASDGYGWDFDTSAFSASPATPQAVLVDTNDQGIYHLAAGWTPQAVTGAEQYTFTVTEIGGATVANVPATWTMDAGPLAGAATLGTNLVDDLVPTVDDLRAELYTDFGVRQFHTYMVRRVWGDTYVGRGAMKVTQKQNLVPDPDVVLEDTHSLTPGGLQATGTATLHEVSLAYSQNQLLGEPLANNEEFHFLVVDALGQGIARRLFIPQDHPVTSRDKELGWSVKIRLTDTPGNVTAGVA